MNPAIITFDAVSHVYEKKGAAHFQALNQLSLTITQGTYTAVLGRSGSGKSTFLNLVAGLDRPSSGSVVVDGHNIGSMSESQLAQWRGERVGVVFQFFQLLPTLSVRENLLLPMEFVNVVPQHAREARVCELLERVGISDQAHKLSGKLSGGQQQRAAIARALVNRPTIVIADEPTGNLDSASAEAVLSLFEQQRKSGVTLVVVTHDPEVAARADDVIELVDGHLATRVEHHREATS